MATIELEDAFADDSLEMDEVGDKFRVAADLQARIVATGPITSAPPSQITVTPAATGAATETARADHVHDVAVATPTALSVGGSNAAGTSTALARADHRHAIPAFGSAAGTFCEGNDARLANARAPLAHKASHQLGGADALSVQGLLGLLADPQTAGGIKTGTTIVNVSLSNAPFAGQTLVASSGTAATWGNPVPPSHAERHADGGADELVVTGLSGELADAQKPKVDGTTTAPPAALAIGSAQAPGVAGTLARSDHVHAMPAAAAAVALVPGGANAAGSAGTFARSDHAHAVPVDDPVALIPGVGFAQGGSSAFARADHRHALPAFGSAAGTFCEGNDARFPAIDQNHRSYYRSLLPADYVNAFTLTKDTIHWVYIGRVNRDVTIAQVNAWQVAVGTGAADAYLCVGTTPGGPAFNSGKTITTKGVATCNIPGGVGVFYSTSWGGTIVITAGSYLWVGIKTSYATTQPKFPNLFSDSNGGLMLVTPGITGAVLNNTTYTANIVPAGQYQSPDLNLAIT